MERQRRPTYDFVVVGGGTSGAVVAGNLARSRQSPTVLVIESGGSNKRPDLRVASERFTNVYINPEIQAKDVTAPQQHLNGRSLDYFRGRGLGGSSIANYEAYMRGSASDYDEWARRVDDDFFAWDNTIEMYKELENLHFQDDGDVNHFVEPLQNAHGYGGPVDISVKGQKFWPLGMDKLMYAAIEYGWPVCRDQNSGNPIGVGCVTTTSYKGHRTTSASAYLNKPMPNLEIWCNANAIKVLFEPQPNGRLRAMGVLLADGRTVSARYELILCGGCIETPKLLLLSGVGPKNELKDVGITPVVNLPGIGKNLMDHVWTHVNWRVNPALSDVAKFQFDPAIAKHSRQEWLRSRTGLDAERNLQNLVAFLRFDPERANLSELERLPEDVRGRVMKPDVPHIEIFLAGLCPADWAASDDSDFFGLTIMLMQPQSKGEVKLVSNNPADRPCIDPAYLSHPYDRQALVNSVREALHFARSTNVSSYIQCETLVPNSDRDEDILSFCEDTVQSVLHGCGTVRMGARLDATACLDPDFRLNGVDNIRVVDLSAMPLITSNHTMATAFLVGQMGWRRLAKEYNLSFASVDTARI